MAGDSALDAFNGLPDAKPVDPVEAFHALPDGPPQTSGTQAFVRGYAAGGTAGFDDELGAKEQFILAHLAKRFPDLAEKVGIETRYANDIDPDSVEASALRENRAEKRLAAKEHNWAYGAGNVVGGVALGSGAAAVAPGLAIPGGAITQSALQGGAQALGEADESRGFNAQTALQVGAGTLAGAGGAWAGSKVGSSLAPFLNKPAQAAQRMADSARGRVTAEALDRASSEVASHNGALGPPKAEFIKNLLRAKDAGEAGLLTPQAEGELAGPLAQKFHQGILDVGDQAVQGIADFQPGTPMQMTPTLLNRHINDVMGERGGEFMRQAGKDALGAVKEIPFFGKAAKAGINGLKAISEYAGNDAAKISIGDTFARAMRMSPQFAQKYGSVIMGASSPAVAHNILQQRDPEYREMLRQYAEDDGN
jgi:hypothetical protein